MARTKLLDLAKKLSPEELRSLAGGSTTSLNGYVRSHEMVPGFGTFLDADAIGAFNWINENQELIGGSILSSRGGVEISDGGWGVR